MYIATLKKHTILINFQAISTIPMNIQKNKNNWFKWKFQFLPNNIKELSLKLHVLSHYEVSAANSMEDALVKKGVERVTFWVGLII